MGVVFNISLLFLWLQAWNHKYAVNTLYYIHKPIEVYVILQPGVVSIYTTITAQCNCLVGIHQAWNLIPSVDNLLIPYTNDLFTPCLLIWDSFMSGTFDLYGFHDTISVNCTLYNVLSSFLVLVSLTALLKKSFLHWYSEVQHSWKQGLPAERIPEISFSWH